MCRKENKVRLTWGFQFKIGSQCRLPWARSGRGVMGVGGMGEGTGSTEALGCEPGVEKRGSICSKAREQRDPRTWALG